MHSASTGLPETMQLELCYYHGKSMISRAIECFTWGEISHVAIRDPNENCVWEAWQEGGVSKVPSISTNHKAGTRVDIYKVDVTPQQYRNITLFLDAQVGKKYDFCGVASFVLRYNVGKDGAWFCSELALGSFQQAGVSLLRCPPFKASPTVLSYSPIQYGKRSEITVKE
jgi:uncharacterized protein YycO